MANCITSDFKVGLKFIYEGAPYVILEHEFVNPGKGQAFYRVKLRNLTNQKLIDKTFKSGESFKLAEIEERTVSYLYQDGDAFFFMDSSTFEQIEVPLELLEEAKPWLLGNEEVCTITLWENKPIAFLPPIFVELRVVETVPGIKGDTANGGSKWATLETGVKVRTPLFIQEGEKIKVDTRTKSYVSRVH